MSIIISFFIYMALLMAKLIALLMPKPIIALIKQKYSQFIKFIITIKWVKKF